jgi:hypothetical protein
MRRTLLALGGVALLATACGSPHPASSPTTAPVPIRAAVVSTTTTSPPFTTPATPITTTVPDTSIVPSTITVAYVDAVLVQLNHIYGDAVRASVKADKLTAAAIADLKALYNSPLGKEEQHIFAQTLAGSLTNIRPVPGDPVTDVDKLVYTSRSCIYAQVRTNFDPIVVRHVPPPADEFMGFEQRPKGRVSGINRTPWILFFDIVNNTTTDVANQCPDP